MANTKIINNDHVLVLGMGVTGFSVVNYLVKMGSVVTVSDSRECPPYLIQLKNDHPQVEILAGNIPYSRFGEFDRIVASPGVALEPECFSSSSKMIGDIELFVQQADVPIIAITGSNGKSTVTMLIAEMLQAAGLNINTGGNIGTPVLDFVDQANPDFYVFELSSFQLETTYSLRACSATVLNVSEDHMDRYSDFKEYSDAKKRIFNNAKNIVLNRDDVISNSWSQDFSNSISFGLDVPPGDIDFGVTRSNDGRHLARGNTLLAHADQVTLQGDQNISNILAAMALVESAGVALLPAVINAALSYGGLPHRCEVVSEINGVKWINDSKGTNVGATIAAIKGFDQEITLIAGGKSKGADFAPLAKIIRENVCHTILFGEDAELIFNSLDKTVKSFRAKTLKDAVDFASKTAQPDSVVLFSPACASFDMFDNYEHRGNEYKQLVWGLAH